MEQKRFCDLWQRCARTPDAAQAKAIFAEMEALYGQPHRHYHCGNHIDDCLARIDLAAAALGRSDDVEMAIWMHDVIYQTGDPDNERLSADWFAAQAAGAFSPERIRLIEGYIMDTTHQQPPTDDGAKFVVDVDLSGIGMPKQQFLRDGENIRKEFPDLSEAEFIRGQSMFLQKLLDRERIYYTPFFYDLCEARARQNIGDLLAG